MERQRRIHDLWNWLPAFRAVAETEHLPTASERLAISPSALSRAVKQLEDELGAPLFHRVGRNLRLNDAGFAVLSAVRDAMRRVDEGVSIATGRQLAGAVRLAICESAHVLLKSAYTELATTQPELELSVTTAHNDDIPERLGTGAVDLVLTDHPRPYEGLRRDVLGELPSGLYARADHHLLEKAQLNLDDLEDESFAAPDRRDESAPFDPWPALAPRRVHVRFSRFDAGVSFVRTTPAVISLPDRYAQVAHPDLVRLKGSDTLALAPYRVHAWRRPVLSSPDKPSVVLEALRSALAAIQ